MNDDSDVIEGPWGDKAKGNRELPMNEIFKDIEVISQWYILDDNDNPVARPLLEAARWLEENRDRKIVKRTHVDGYRISSVFLGLDHSFSGDTPELWETMIFIEDANGATHGDIYQRRHFCAADATHCNDHAAKMLGDSFTRKRFLDEECYDV